MAQSPSLPSAPRPPSPSLSLTRARQAAGPFGLDRQHGTELSRCSGPGHCTAYLSRLLPTAQEPAPRSLPGRLGSPAVLGGQALPGDPAGHKAKALKVAPEGRQGCRTRGPGRPVLAFHPSHRLSLLSKWQTRAPRWERTVAQWQPGDLTRHCAGRREPSAGRTSSFPRTQPGQWPGEPTRGEPTIKPAGQKPPKHPAPAESAVPRTDGPRDPSVGVVHSEKGHPSALGGPSGFRGDELGPQAQCGLSTGPAPPGAWGSALRPLLTPVRLNHDRSPWPGQERAHGDSS